MKIDVRSRGLDAADALREHTLRRIRSHLHRFHDRLTAVEVRLGDVNGPRGGVDKQCRITVRGPGLGAATLDELHGDPFAAIDVAVRRIAYAVSRTLDRRRTARPR
ncbi:MAG: HPF/RaiA family ribosome-associated protein [Myxococcales bacterium]|nr:HPF/RaiA family ribosome-associated protein [Myxococcales bacterium]